MELIFIISFAILNRARGSQLFGLVTSTTIGRIVSTGGMAIIVALYAFLYGYNALIIGVWAWMALFLWSMFAWDNYWSAAIGNPTDIIQRAFPPVDWIMSKLPQMPLRLWGAIAMGLRQGMVIPCLVGLAFMFDHQERAYLAVTALFLGIPYVSSGYLSKTKPIFYAELEVGALMGWITYSIVA